MDKSETILVLEDIENFINNKEEKVNEKQDLVQSIKKVFLAIHKNNIAYFLANIFIVPSPINGETWDIYNIKLY